MTTADDALLRVLRLHVPHPSPARTLRRRCEAHRDTPHVQFDTMVECLDCETTVTLFCRECGPGRRGDWPCRTIRVIDEEEERS